MIPRKPAPFFVSAAQDDMPLLNDLLGRLKSVLAASKNYEFCRWIFTEIGVGVEWSPEILAALERHRVGLLLVSPAFLASDYIVKKELPLLLAPGRIALPVQLKPVDMRRMEMHGLDALQIFATRVRNERRAYSELGVGRREAFVFALFQAIEARLDRELAAA